MIFLVNCNFYSQLKMGNSLSCFDDSEQNNVVASVNLKEKNSSCDNGTASPRDHDMDKCHHILWEFQRYNPNYGWGAGPNFEPGDPGRWATEDEQKFGDSLASVAPPVPDGYKIDLNWAIVVKKKIRKMKHSEGGDVDETGITDRFGWHYGKTFNAKKWSDEHMAGSNVRRRAWKRTIVKRKSKKSTTMKDE